MKSILLFILLASSLFSSLLPEPIPDLSPQQIEWLNSVDQALDSPDYCRLLSELALSPYADPDINPVLIDILVSKCN